MKITVIGASGHVGSYTVPELVRRGHRVTAVSRGNRPPYCPGPEWDEVEILHLDRSGEGFDEAIAQTKPEAVCDLICYTKEQARSLCAALGDTCHFIVQIGSIWIYDHCVTLPAGEDHPRNATDSYGQGKAEIEEYLFHESPIPATVIHPGHICGRGWLPINPQGNLNPQVFTRMMAGKEILLPGWGTSTLHHVHSGDIAVLTALCLENPQTTAGQAFHAVTPNAVTLKGYAEAMFARYGHEPRIRLTPWNEFQALVSEDDYRISVDHARRSPCAGMDKTKALLGFTPAYDTFATIGDSLDYLEETGLYTNTNCTRTI